MDRQISAKTKQQRKRRQLIRILLSAVALVVVIASLLWAFDSSIPASAFRIGEVDRGSLDIAVNSTGTVSPLVEEIIVSPINTRIVEAYKKAGDMVEQGEPLLRLELSAVETEYRQKLDEHEMMKSKLVQIRIKLENAISDLRMQQQVKQMQIKQLYTELQSEKYLDSIGASTTDKVRKAELGYEEARLQLQQLDQKIINESQNAAAEIRIQELELSIFEKTLAESERLLKDARILSPRAATLTFINDQIGVQVAQGAQVAVVSDLTRYMVNAEVADTHRDKIAAGARAVIRINKTDIDGTVINVTPSVTNGVLKFTVIPDDPDNEALRSGVKADVNVIHGSRTDILRIPYGNWYKYGQGDYYLWVVKDGKAEKRRVSVGGNSYEYVEIIEGLSEGEKVITSDMEDYIRKQSLKIK